MLVIVFIVGASCNPFSSSESYTPDSLGTAMSGWGGSPDHDYTVVGHARLSPLTPLDQQGEITIRFYEHGTYGDELLEETSIIPMLSPGESGAFEIIFDQDQGPKILGGPHGNIRVEAFADGGYTGVVVDEVVTISNDPLSGFDVTGNEWTEVVSYDLVDITGYEYSGWGNLENNTEEIMESITVVIDLYDRKGNLLVQCYDYVDQIPPGATGTYHWKCRTDSLIAHNYVTWEAFVRHTG